MGGSPINFWLGATGFVQAVSAAISSAILNRFFIGRSSISTPLALEGNVIVSPFE
jgi:hypothetical protein